MIHQLIKSALALFLVYVAVKFGPQVRGVVEAITSHPNWPLFKHDVQRANENMEQILIDEIRSLCDERIHSRRNRQSQRR